MFATIVGQVHDVRDRLQGSSIISPRNVLLHLGNSGRRFIGLVLACSLPRHFAHGRNG
jgi:hypothetical protein